MQLLCFGIEFLSPRFILFLEILTVSTLIPFNSIEGLGEIPNSSELYGFMSFLILYELAQTFFHNSRLTLANDPAYFWVILLIW